MGKRWYVARVHPGQEKAVASKLREPFLSRPAFEAYVPLRRERGNSWALFPGYVIVEIDLDDDNWAPINGIVGVVKLLPSHLIEPEPLPVGFVEAFRMREAAGDFDLRAAEEVVLLFRPGDQVEVKSGTYQGERGTFKSQRAGYVSLLMSVLGGRGLVKLPASQLA